MPTRVGLPTHSHAIAGIQSEHGTSGSHDFANDLMARDERVLADSPVIVDHMDIVAANPAMRDGNFHLVLLDIAGIVLVR